MKKFKYNMTAGVCLAAAVFFAGCGNQQNTTAKAGSQTVTAETETLSEREADETSIAESFDMDQSKLEDIGDMRIVLNANTLKLELYENPSTGYLWTCTSSNEAVLKITEDHYESDQNDEEEPLSGVGGVHTVTLTSGQPGEVIVRLSHGRSGEEPEIEKELHLIVDADGKVDYAKQ